MSSEAESLVEALLHNANASEDRVLERRLADTALWFHKNMGSIPRDNLASRQAFLEKAFWIMVEIQALLVERNHELEAAKRGMSNLWLPRGVKVGGSMREFG